MAFATGWGTNDGTWISREEREEGDFGGEQGRESTQEDSNRDAYEL